MSELGLAVCVAGFQFVFLLMLHLLFDSAEEDSGCEFRICSWGEDVRCPKV